MATRACACGTCRSASAGRSATPGWPTWAAAVDVAVAELPDDERESVRAELLGYFAPAAEQLRNDTGLPISSARR